MKTKLHVFDMDGTLVDSSHRYRTITDKQGNQRIDLDHWIANEHRVMHDELLPLAEEYQELLTDRSTYVVIATARIWCDLTDQFAKEKLGYPHSYFARKDRQDTRGGAALKIVGVKKLFNLKQFSQIQEVHVYEDNISYLKTICHAMPSHVKTVGHYFPSKQGH